MDERAETVDEVTAEIVPTVDASAGDECAAASAAAFVVEHDTKHVEEEQPTAAIKEERPQTAIVEEDTASPGRFIGMRLTSFAAAPVDSDFFAPARRCRSVQHSSEQSWSIIPPPARFSKDLLST